VELKHDLKSLELQRFEEVAILETEKTRFGDVLAAGARRCVGMSCHT